LNPGTQPLITVIVAYISSDTKPHVISIEFIHSSILRQYDRNPLGTKIILRGPSQSTQPSGHGSGGSSSCSNQSWPNHHNNSDDKVLRAIPCYPKVAKYLAQVLRDSYKHAPPYLLSNFDSSENVWKEFRHQIASWAHGEYPFSRMKPNQWPLEYWKGLMSHDNSGLLAVCDSI
jgi:hypothetical protein